MIDLNKCELIETRVANLLSTVGSVEEGTPMVFAFENGLRVVKPATGVATEQYAGCALGRPATPGIVPKVDNLAIPASGAYTVNLTKVQSGSAIRVVAVAANGTRTPLTAGVATNAAEYTISGGLITVNSAQAGKTLEVIYNYAITLQEAVMLYKFDGLAAASVNIGTIGLVTTGRVYLTNYDITVDWSSQSPSVAVTVGAGVFTIGGSGVELDAVVEELPSASSNGMLALRFHP